MTMKECRESGTMAVRNEWELPLRARVGACPTRGNAYSRQLGRAGADGAVGQQDWLQCNGERRDASDVCVRVRRGARNGGAGKKTD